MAINLVLNDLWERLDLSQAHRESLKINRGFSDATINQARLASAKPENEAIVLELLDDYSVAELEEAGLGDRQNEKLKIAAWLLRDNILIPTIVDDKIIYARAHKFGPKNIAPPLFRPAIPPEDKTFLVLAESEFKALAAAQLGFFAVGLQGVSQFAGDRLGELKSFITGSGATLIVILFDNQDKISSDSKYHKPDLKSRYDVEYYEYVLAHEIGKIEGVDCKIARLPDSWRVNGGVDVDGALAAGHTRQEFIDILAAAAIPSQARKAWSKECAEIVERKLKRYFFVSPIEIAFGRYVKITSKQTIPISNFTLRIVHNYVEDGETEDEKRVVRGVQIVGEDGAQSQIFDWQPDEIASLPKFLPWLISKGNYHFSGGARSLAEIWKRLATFDDGAIIESPYYIGRYTDVYLSGSCVIDDNGEIHKPRQEHGREIVRAGARSFRPRSIDYLKSHAEHKLYLDETVDYEDAFHRICDNWGSYSPALGCGWMIASVFADAVFERYRLFPLLFIGGRKEGGKTSLAELYTAFHGTDATTADASSQVGMERLLGYYSNMAVWLDEYRASERMGAKLDAFLRSVYNRQDITKGLRDNTHQVRRMPVRATLMLSGESIPGDAALSTRFIQVIVDKNKMKGHEWKWLCANRWKFSSAYAQWAAARKTKLPEYLDAIDEHRATFVSGGIDERYALNYAISLAALDIFTPRFSDKLPAFDDFMVEHMAERQTETNESHILAQFLHDIAYCHQHGKLLPRNLDVSIHENVHAYLPGLWSDWCKFRKDSGLGTDGFNRMSISQYLRETGWKYKPCRFEGELRKGFSIEKKLLPAEIQQLLIPTIEQETMDYADK